MKVFQNSNWIWDNRAIGEDTYCEFIQKFTYNEGECFCNISCDRIGQNTGNSDLVWWSYPIAEIVSLAVTLLFYFRLNRTILSKLPDNGESDTEGASCRN